MRTTLITLSFATGLVSSCASVAVAQSSCPPREVVLRNLLERGLQRQSIGIDSDGDVAEVFASVETGRWTLIFTRADGTTCVAVEGYAFENTKNEARLHPGLPS